MATYIQIGSTVTVGSGGASSISFSSIASTYTDLLLDLSLRSNRSNDASGDEMYIYFNGSNTNVSSRILYGTGSAAASYSSGSAIIGLGCASNSATASTFGNMQVYISNYASTTTFKSVSIDGVSENNATAAYSSLSAGLWSSNSAINSITIDVINGTDFLQYSTATLYGISKS